MHAVCGYPVKSTWIHTIKVGNYVGWPILTERNVRKYYPETDETIKGHMNQTRKNVRSTKTKQVLFEIVECEIIYTLTLTLQLGKSLVRPNMLMIMHVHGSHRQLPHVIRWSVYNPSSHEHFVMYMWPYCTGITSVLESRLYLQSKHMTSPL